MKSLRSWIVLGVVCAASSTVTAGDFFRLAGRPSLLGSAHVFGGYQEAAPPAPIAEGEVQGGLFECVKYVDTHEMAPCAEPMVIEVVDPCWKPNPCDCSCPKKPKCVKVQICVPKHVPASCCCPKKNSEPKVRCSHDGRRVHYDYGKYAVDVRVRKDHIVVDYQD